jgi:hypothetical protein
MMAHNPTPATDVNDPARTQDGLIRDEYTDPSLENVRELDALDVPSALRSERVLDGVADDVDGIDAIDLEPGGSAMDTVDTGARNDDHVDDEGDMAFGAEPHDADELSEATVGSAERGGPAMTRDDQVHGEALFDSPDDPEPGDDDISDDER